MTTSLKIYMIILFAGWLTFIIPQGIRIGRILKKYSSFTPLSGWYNMTKDDIQKIRKYLRYLAFSVLVFFLLVFIGAEIAVPQR